MPIISKTSQKFILLKVPGISTQTSWMFSLFLLHQTSVVTSQTYVRINLLIQIGKLVLERDNALFCLVRFFSGVWRYSRLPVLHFIMDDLCVDCFEPEERADGDTEALCRMVQRGHIHCIRKFLQTTSDVNGLNMKGDTPLTVAAKNGDVDILAEVIKSGADVNLNDSEGCSATLWSSLKGFPECVNVLGQAGADVNMKNNLGETPLGWAAQNGHSACIEALIKQGADVNLSSENHSLWAFINKVIFGNTALILATEENHVGCVDAIIAAGADVNKPNGSEEGPLMIAAQNGLDKCVERLIKAGADVDRPSDSITPLAAAVSTKMSFFCNKNDNEFSTPQRTNCIKLLIDAGADVNTKCVYGDPITIRVLIEGNYNYLDLLVQAGADVNAVDCTNSTAMSYAVTHYHSVGFARKCVKLLLRAGAKMNISRNSHGLYSCAEMNITRDTRGLYSFVRNRHLRDPRRHKEMCMMLFAAGETVNPDQVQCCSKRIPNFVLHNEDLHLCLKHLCREAIRKHLLNMSQVNLFARIPQLELPSIINDYLLYGVNLEDDGDDDANDESDNANDDDGRDDDDDDIDDEDNDDDDIDDEDNDYDDEEEVADDSSDNDG